jgi:hypothetical protein
LTFQSLYSLLNQVNLSASQPSNNHVLVADIFHLKLDHIHPELILPQILKGRQDNITAKTIPHQSSSGIQYIGLLPEQMQFPDERFQYPFGRPIPGRWPRAWSALNPPGVLTTLSFTMTFNAIKTVARREFSLGIETAKSAIII